MIRAPNEDALQEAVRLLQTGELVGIPTETVYGLGGLATSREAVAKIFALKGRPSSNPLIVHLASPSQLHQCAVIDQKAKWVHRLNNLTPLWPGPISILLPKATHLPTEVTAGGPLVAVRIPSHPVALELLRRVQAPIAAPSANMSGRVSPTTAQHVVDEFGDRLALILDGGACHQGIESTVISLTEDRPRLLRPGAVPVDVLESLLGEAVEELPIGSSDISRDRFEAPGMMTSHYAPVTPVLFKHDYRSSEETDQRVGVLWFSSTEPEFPYETILRLSQNNDPLEIAPKLFASLRELDALKLNRIIVDTCPPKGLGLAVMDRLRRATVRT